MLIGIGVILLVFVLQKTGVLDRIRGLSEDDYEDEEEEPDEQQNGGATAYKRRSAR